MLSLLLSLTAVQMLCDNMGDQMANTCKQYVDVYAPAVFAMAMGYLVPGGYPHTHVPDDR